MLYCRTCDLSPPHTSPITANFPLSRVAGDRWIQFPGFWLTGYCYIVQSWEDENSPSEDDGLSFFFFIPLFLLVSLQVIFLKNNSFLPSSKPSVTPITDGMKLSFKVVHDHSHVSIFMSISLPSVPLTLFFINTWLSSCLVFPPHRMPFWPVSAYSNPAHS